jgi:ATP phosphoribosyltransferase
MLTIAMAKGRIMQAAVALMERAGYLPPENLEKTRKLILSDEVNQIRYLLAKPVDVPTYVERGAADLGVVGKDVLLEANSDVHELLDLGVGRCRLSIAGPPDLNLNQVRRVGTKYLNYTRNYFLKRNQQVETIYLNGSVELAPLIGLADCIVDLVETGRTLEENGLITWLDLEEISTRLIANRGSYQLRIQEVDLFTKRLRAVLS